MSNTSIYTKHTQGSTFGGKKVLNVGCGFSQYKSPNVVNLDAFDVCKPDVVWDLNKTPLPFEDETFDVILANHILEHIPNWWECFNDLARVLKPGGRLEVYVPATGSDSVRGYRDHVVEINSCSLFGIWGTYRAGGNAWADENAMCPANRLKQLSKMSTCENKWWITKAPHRLKKWMAAHLRNTMVEDGYIFTKVTVQEHEAERREFHDRQQSVRRNLSLEVSRLP